MVAKNTGLDSIMVAVGGGGLVGGAGFPELVLKAPLQMIGGLERLPGGSPKVVRAGHWG